jgi:short-subunit dehydrogenase involved in D-alanine esterification of teichoic acids
MKGNDRSKTILITGGGSGTEKAAEIGLAQNCHNIVAKCVGGRM